MPGSSGRADQGGAQPAEIPFARTSLALIPFGSRMRIANTFTHSNIAMARCPATRVIAANYSRWGQHSARPYLLIRNQLLFADYSQA